MSQLTASEKTTLIERWQAVTAQLPPNVTLLAVSKAYPSEAIATLYKAGQTAFGENYVQEALTKIAELDDLKHSENPLQWHYIGHIQRNKTRDLAEHFDWVQGVDRLIIAQRLNEQRPEHLPPLNICIQVNIDDEASKSGCTPDALPELVQAISQLPKLRLRGLMVIPAPVAKHANQTAFTQTHLLFENARPHHTKPDDWDTLSMGMSGDMEEATASGSTMVRIGTAIFGSRK